jgi:predicted Zn-dependent protease
MIENLEWLERMIELVVPGPPDEEMIRLKWPLWSLKLGDVEEALAVAQALVSNTPQDARAWLVLGEITRTCQMWERARQAATRAYELDPVAKQSMFLYALLLGEFGQLKEHRGMLERLVAQHPRFLNAYLDLAKIELLDGDYALGLETLRSAFLVKQPIQGLVFNFPVRGVAR